MITPSTILKNLDNRKQRRLYDHILILDSTNTFIRNFAKIGSMNPDGAHVGGLVGFLRSLGYLVRTIDPTLVICVFDGPGASTNKKYIDPSYKSHRETTRVTSWEIFDNKSHELISMSDQLNRALDYLEHLPVKTIQLPKIEADEVISYLARNFDRKDKKVTVVSSDRDFFQIVSKNVQIYNPITKKYFTDSEILNTTGVLPCNYIYMKILTGDKSDNVQGINGIGVKGVVKLFPELKAEQFTLDRLYSISKDRLTENKRYAQIIHEWDNIKRYYRLMDLTENELSDNEIISILQELSKNIIQVREGPFFYLLKQDKIEGIVNNTESWLQTFNYLSNLKK